MKSLLTILLALLLGACAQFKSAPRLEKAITVNGAVCDAKSNLVQVRACVARLKTNYVDAADALATENRGAGMFLLSMAGVAGGVELFDGGRRITQGAGLLGGFFAGKDRYIPRATLITALEQGKSRLECTLVKSAEFEAQAAQIAPEIAKLLNDYTKANQELDQAMTSSTANRLAQSKVEQAEDALYEMKAACNQTTFMRLTNKQAGDKSDEGGPHLARELTKDQHARKLYAVAVSISDGVVSQFNGAVAPTADITAELEKTLKTIKAATAEAAAMSKAADKLVVKADEALAATNAVAGTDCKAPSMAADKPDAATAICMAKETADKLKEKVGELKEKIEQLAITAKTLEACAGVVVGGGQ